MKQPKYLLAQHGGREWVVRTRHPFIVGEVKQMGAVVTFDLWPLEIVRELDEAKIDALTASMSRWYHHAKGWPYSQVPTGSN